MSLPQEFINSDLHMVLNRLGYDVTNAALYKQVLEKQGVKIPSDESLLAKREEIRAEREIVKAERINSTTESKLRDVLKSISKDQQAELLNKILGEKK